MSNNYEDFYKTVEKQKKQLLVDLTLVFTVILIILASHFI